MIIDTSKINQTELVEGVAKAIVDRRAELRESAPTWESLSNISKHHLRETVMPIVTLTIASMEAQTLVTVDPDLDMDDVINRLLNHND